MPERIYCTGELTPAQRKALLARKLDEGMVCTDYVPRGQNGNDVAYFRKGTEEEVAECRKKMSDAARAAAVTSSVAKAITEGDNRYRQRVLGQGPLPGYPVVKPEPVAPPPPSARDVGGRDVG